MLIDNEHNRKLVRNLLGKLPRDQAIRILVLESYVNAEGEVAGYILVPRITTRSNDGSRPSTSWYRRIRMTESRFRRLEFQPATVEASPVTVYASFSVVATRTNKETETVIVMNRLQRVDDLGLYYSAPQRLSIGFQRPSRDDLDTIFDVGVNVDASGAPTSVNFKEREDGPSRFMDEVIEEMRTACYIPGRANGVPTEMIYVERFSNYGDSF